jgi:hypothetical protein
VQGDLVPWLASQTDILATLGDSLVKKYIILFLIIAWFVYSRLIAPRLSTGS